MEQQIAQQAAEHSHMMDMAFTLFGMLLCVLGISKPGSKVKLLNIELTSPTGWRRTLCMCVGLVILVGVGVAVYMQH